MRTRFHTTRDGIRLRVGAAALAGAALIALTLGFTPNTHLLTARGSADGIWDVASAPAKVETSTGRRVWLSVSAYGNRSGGWAVQLEAESRLHGLPVQSYYWSFNGLGGEVHASQLQTEINLPRRKIGKLGNLQLTFKTVSSSPKRCPLGHEVVYRGLLTGNIQLRTGYGGNGRASTQSPLGRISESRFTFGGRRHLDWAVEQFNCGGGSALVTCQAGVTWSSPNISRHGTTISLHDYFQPPGRRGRVLAEAQRTIRIHSGFVDRADDVVDLTPPQSFVHDTLTISTHRKDRYASGSAMMVYSGPPVKPAPFRCMGPGGRIRTDYVRSYTSHLTWRNGAVPLTFRLSLDRRVGIFDGVRGGSINVTTPNG